MTPDRAALRELAQRALEPIGNTVEAEARWLRELARAYLDITAPLLVKCENCGGKGYIPDPWPESKTGWDCPTCHGTGSVERADLAEIRQRFEDAPHARLCNWAMSEWRGPKLRKPCDCWKSTFALDALLELVTAQAREIERLKGNANG